MYDSINELAKEVYQNAVDHGWWSRTRSFGDITSLINSEVSEAFEEYRNGRMPNETYYVDGKPEGIPSEMADIIIRVLDYCEHEGIDIGNAIRLKHEYNKTRPFRHGGKKC